MGDTLSESKVKVDEDFWTRRIISGDHKCPGRPEMWITQKFQYPKCGNLQVNLFFAGKPKTQTCKHFGLLIYFSTSRVQIISAQLGAGTKQNNIYSMLKQVAKN